MSLDNLHPCREGHAVKEAAITLHVNGKLRDIDQFRGISDVLFELENNDDYRFELIHSKKYSVQFKSQELENDGQLESSTPFLSGFKYQLVENDQVVCSLQGINEEHRTTITFHELKYERWAIFIEKARTFFEAVSKIQPETRLKAHSLHVADQFLWSGKEPLPLSKVFNKKNSVIPHIADKATNFDSLTAFNYEDQVERVHVSVTDNNHRLGSTINLSHLITKVYKEIISIADLNSLDAYGSMASLHISNKELLEDLFVDKVLDKINFNS